MDKGKSLDNRINLVMAIIFLFFLAVVARLFQLQVLEHGKYQLAASNQHESFNTLQPSRGRIFLQDSEASDSSGLYPVATNKDFALLYISPKEIMDASQIPALAEVLYNNLDQALVQAEARYEIENEYNTRLQAKLDAFSDLAPEEAQKQKDRILKQEADAKLENDELKQGKLAARLEEKRKQKIEHYIKILNKKDDPYEEIAKKVNEETLKQIYSQILRIYGKEFRAEDMTIRNNAVYVTDSGKQKELSVKGCGHKMEAYRFYPEGNISSHLIGFVGYGGDDRAGQNGIEGYFEKELKGMPGSVRAERDAKGELIIINDREYQPSVDGSDIILTIDHTIQYNACQKLNQAVRKHGADGGSVIIMDPKTGAVWAMCAYPDYDPNNYREVKNISVFNNPAIFDQYEPGSIFKALTMAAALDTGKVKPDTTYTDTGNVSIAGYNIQNSDKKANGVVNMSKVLELSLNTGVIFAMRQATPKVFVDYVKKFGFGERTGIELQGESLGDIRSLDIKKNNELYAATASFGQGIAVTPIQMVSAFGAMANGGILMKPYIVKEIVRPDGERVITQPRQIRRAVSERTSMLIGGLLVNVVEFGHGKKAGVPGYWIGGKTGTAQVARKDGRGYEANAHNGSFAGYGPIDDPAFVMLVRIDHPRDVEWAESSAAPLFGELAKFVLDYKQIPPTRKDEAKK